MNQITITYEDLLDIIAAKEVEIFALRRQLQTLLTPPPLSAPKQPTVGGNGAILNPTEPD